MKRLIYLLAIALTAHACETELDISSVAYQKRLVVNALLNDADPVKIEVTSTTVIQDSIKPAPVSNATVVITDEAGTKFNCTFDLFTEKYTSNLVMQTGKKYSIEVSAPGYPNATSTLLMPAKSGSTSATWKDATGQDSFGFPTGTIYSAINDDGGSKNYYRLTIYYWDDIRQEWISLKPPMNDAELENSAIETEDGGWVFSDKLFNGKERKIEFTTEFGVAMSSPKFLVVTENLSENYYRYFKSINDYQTGGGVFSEPSQIYTNIQNGVGIFAGSTIRKDVIN